jgi:hemolysin III
MKRLLKNTEDQTLVEELFNSISHFIGALLSIAGLIVLILKASSDQHHWAVISSCLFGASLIIMYLSSTVYHICQNFSMKKTLQIVDHACIYLLIAGTYTPFTLITLHGPWGWSLFGVVWGLATLGITFKCFFTGKFDKLSVLFYILMGWVAIIAIKPLINNLTTQGVSWMVAGGLFYTLGTFFYIKDSKYKFSHSIWHLFVLAGSICHFACVYWYVL